MHGDEPTATVALLDVLNHLGKTRETPATKALLSKLTLAVIPMLNPDGAERTRRTNAQGIDINRDALRLQTPEGRFLKSVRDRLTPAVGYNLHNQGPNTLAGTFGRPGGDRAPRRSVRRGVHGERGAPHDEAARGPRARPPAALRAGPRLALRHGVHGARLRRFHDALGDADAPDRVGRLRGRGRRGGRGARAAELRRAARHAVRPRGRLRREGGRRGVRRDPAQRARPPLRRRRPPRARDRGRRAPALPRGRRAGTSPSRGRASRAARWAAGAAARSSRWATSTTYKGKSEIDATNLVLVVAPPGGAEGWTKALDGLKAKGLATPDGTLTLSLAALSQEAKAWLDGAPGARAGLRRGLPPDRARRRGPLPRRAAALGREPLGEGADDVGSTYSGRRIPARTTSTPGVARSARSVRWAREPAAGAAPANADVTHACSSRTRVFSHASSRPSSASASGERSAKRTSPPRENALKGRFTRTPRPAPFATSRTLLPSSVWIGSRAPVSIGLKGSWTAAKPGPASGQETRRARPRRLGPSRRRACSTRPRRRRCARRRPRPRGAGTPARRGRRTRRAPLPAGRPRCAASRQEVLGVVEEEEVHAFGSASRASEAVSWSSRKSGEIACQRSGAVLDDLASTAAPRARAGAPRRGSRPGGSRSS